jgi:hypothetical protein
MDEQDPNGLAARVAYHLHRHGISVKQLNQAGMTFDVARALRQGKLQLNAFDVQHIAMAVQLEPEELSRALGEQEAATWRFYRIAARNATEVWRRVAAASTAANVSQRQLGMILRLPQRTLSKLLSGKASTPILHYEQADEFAGVIGVQQGADYFVEGFPERHDSQPSR